MFFHVFKNSFVITASAVPSEIRLNYKIKDLTLIDFPMSILDIIEKNHSENEIVFYKIKDDLFDPVIKRYCLLMGLDYSIYLSIIDKAYVYYYTVVYPYEPMFKDYYKPIHPKKFMMRGQTIPWNHGILPFEFWINHVFYEPYADKIYKKMYKDSKYRGEFIDFIKDPYYNMCFNSEFDCIMYNKNLMYLLIKKKYIIRGEKSKITEKELREFNRANREEKPNYDNKSIYQNLPCESRYSTF